MTSIETIHAFDTPLTNLRRAILQLNRLISPEGDIVNELLQRDLPMLDDSNDNLFRMVRDQFTRITEMLEYGRARLAAIYDVQQSIAANTIEESVRRLTAASIILTVTTLVSSIYGMNFDNMPELGWQFGYLYALGLMLGVALLLYAFFKRKGWV